MSIRDNKEIMKLVDKWRAEGLKVLVPEEYVKQSVSITKEQANMIDKFRVLLEAHGVKMSFSEAVRLLIENGKEHVRVRAGDSFVGMGYCE